MTKYIQHGNVYEVTDNGSLVVFDKLPTATYTIGMNPMTGEFLLKTIDPYVMEDKIYGDVAKKADRILNTFKSRTVATGLLLSGEKGCGKTMLAKLLAIEGQRRDYPTIVINMPLCGEKFNQFIQSIDQPCVIIFDEYEKVYNEEVLQNKMLTLLDGVYPTQKLFVLTTNEYSRINTNMLNRPGRLFYSLEYTGLDEQFVREYAVDNLTNKEHIAGLVQLSLLFKNFNFDMLKALVEEMNRYQENAAAAIKMMNIKVSSYATHMEIHDFIYKGSKALTYTSYERDGFHVDPLKPFGLEIFPTLKDREAHDNDEDEYESEEIAIQPDNCTSIKNGSYTFQGKDWKLVLKKKVFTNKPWDIDSYLGLVA